MMFKDEAQYRDVAAAAPARLGSPLGAVEVH
jgi:hypothetical protein